MEILTVWNNNKTGLNEECLRNENGNYIGIKTGTIYDCHVHYHSQQYEAIIISVDETNMTGMYHLYKELNDNNNENNKKWKRKFIGCYVTVEKTHWCGEKQIYRCLELGDYWSSDEIKLL